MSTNPDLAARLDQLEVQLAALIINTRHLLTVVGQLTAYSDFGEDDELERERAEMNSVLETLNQRLKQQRDLYRGHRLDAALEQLFGYET